MTLEVKYTDGIQSDVTHVDNIQSYSYPYSHEFIWTGQSAKITAVQIGQSCQRAGQHGFRAQPGTFLRPVPSEDSITPTLEGRLTRFPRLP